MRVLRILAGGIFVLATLLSARGQSTNTNTTTTVLGQWDFNNASLATPTTGAPLQFLGSLQGFFETNQINGRPAGVMRLPAPASPQQSLLATFNHVANAGGTNLNQYTILMDVMWPSQSDNTWRAIFNSSTNNSDDAEIFVNPDNQVGIFNDYALSLPANQWHRLVLVYDLTNTANQVVRYLSANTNGAPQQLDVTGLDSRFSLRGGLLFFSDNDGETAEVYVNSLQLRAGAMTAAEIAALGGPSSGGLGQGPDPVGDVRISSIRRSDGNVIIEMTGGRNVQLQKTVSLANPAWTPVGTAGPGPFTVQIAEPTAFFRAELR